MATTVADLNVTLRASLGGFARDLKEAERKVSGFATRLKRTGRAFSSVGRSLRTNVSIPLALAGAASFKFARDFETQMQRTITLADITREEMSQLKEEILKLAPAVGRGPEELAEGLFFLVSSGIEASDAMALLEVSAKSAALGMGTTRQVVDLLTSAMNAYRETGLTAARAGDILTVAVQEGKIEADELVNSISRVLPVASDLGVSFADVAASAAAMSRTGANADQAMTQLRRVIVGLQASAPQSREALARVGITMQKLRDVAAQPGGLINALLLITNAVGDNKEVMQEIFPNIRQLTGVLALAGKTANETVKIFNRMEGSTGELKTSFAEVSETAQHKMNVSFAKLRVSAVKLGNALLDPVTLVLEQLAEIAVTVSDNFNMLDDDMKSLVIKIAAFTVIVGPLAIVFGSLFTAMGTVVTVIAVLLPFIGVGGLIAAGLVALTAIVFGGAEAFEALKDSMDRTARIAQRNTMRELVPEFLIIALSSLNAAIKAGAPAEEIEKLLDRVNTLRQFLEISDGGIGTFKFTSGVVPDVPDNKDPEETRATPEGLVKQRRKLADAENLLTEARLNGVEAARLLAIKQDAREDALSAGLIEKEKEEFIDLALSIDGATVSYGDVIEVQTKLQAANISAVDSIIGLKLEFLALQDPMVLLSLGLESFANNLATTFNSLLTGTQSAKEAFSNFAKSMITDLLAIMARSIALGIVLEALGFLGGFGGVIGVAATAAKTLLTPKTRAGGGPLAAGQASIVGEFGPEVFVPSTAGRVIPNGMTGQGINFELNIINQGPPLEATKQRQTATTLDVIVKAVVNSGLNDGSFDTAMRRNFAGVRTGQ